MNHMNQCQETMMVIGWSLDIHWIFIGYLIAIDTVAIDLPSNQQLIAAPQILALPSALRLLPPGASTATVVGVLSKRGNPPTWRFARKIIEKGISSHDFRRLFRVPWGSMGIFHGHG
jgi:hypothetical protein